MPPDQPMHEKLARVMHLLEPHLQYMPGPDANVWGIPVGCPVWWIQVPESHVEFIAEAVLTRWLIGEGYHSFDWAYNSDMERVELSLYDDEPYWGKTELDALVSAVCAAGGGK